MTTRLLISEETYARLLDSSGNSITSKNGALSVTLDTVDTSGTMVIRGITPTAEGRLPSDVSGIVVVRNTVTAAAITSTTTAWNGVFGDTSRSAVHDGTYHGRYNIFGAVNSSCTLVLEFSDTSATWYSTHHVVMVGTDGIIDGAFDDIVVPYVRLRKQGSGDVCGTVLVCGKGL
jgi:hypothetical protein